ncbi:MAG: PilZ domain-containing protein [Candidatus Acidiferrum sp.]
MATDTAVSTVSIPSGKALEERWERLRTHPRIVSRVKFQVEWEEGSQRQRANGVTVDVSTSGCLAVVGAGLPLRKRVRLINPMSGRTAEAQVVWRDHEAWDVGLELVKPDAAFWGVKF